MKFQFIVAALAIASSQAFVPATFSVTRSPSALASTPAATDYEAELKKIEDDAKKRMDDKVKELKDKIDAENK
ncbi:hypothetical protein TrLO_g9908 [Triparma laevis f. longispina]|uniref:Uncharacterized protein n=1 Tax=Triparma laevis f. longispina TaxID=1714387 RepID=A0A9W7A444_9STRA|nr:hypothetical protein TrLO_g9908 [Triparma laevis f. longispina]